MSRDYTFQFNRNEEQREWRAAREEFDFHLNAQMHREARAREEAALRYLHRQTEINLRPTGPAEPSWALFDDTEVAGLQATINEVHSRIAVTNVDRERRTVTMRSTTWARGPLRKDDMDSQGHKVHLTTKDGYRKTIRLPGVVGERVSIPEQINHTRGVSHPSQEIASVTIRRRNFKLLRKAVYTDLTTGHESSEYWATEE